MARRPGGRLDAGTYTIFAVDRPANRYSLRDASYSTYTVTLGRPGMTVGISGGTSGTATLTVVPTTVPTTTATPEPTPAPSPNIWELIAAWFSSLFRVSAAEPAGYTPENGMITLSGTTIFSAEKELAVSVVPYFTAAAKGSAPAFSGWSDVVRVVAAGDGGVNVWSVTAAVPAGEYLVTVEPIGGGAAMSWEIHVNEETKEIL